MNEVSLKPVIEELENLFSKFNARFFADKLEKPVITVSPDHTRGAYELKPDKVQTSGPKDTLGETIAKIMSLEDDINTRIDELVTMKKEAFSMISKVPDLDQQNVLVGRYIQLKKWEDLAAEFEYTTQWLFEIHGKALLAFAKENADFLKEPSKV